MQVDFGLISIIMAAYNAEKTIEQAINSVLNQTYPNFELLVVNDCSTDKTAALVDFIWGGFVTGLTCVIVGVIYKNWLVD